MADPEKQTPEVVATDPSPDDWQKPKGWKYNSLKIGSFTFPWYASPQSQLVIVGFVCFMCPGMFNALSGLGGGGLSDPSAQDKANTGLYATFAIVAFFAGTIVNWLGIRVALSFGGVGYCIYVASFLSYTINGNTGFVIFAGVWLGLCAGLLWTAQGAIMMSYPPEHSKGKYISWFWVIFNFGAVLGSLIPLGENLNNQGSTVTTGTYIGFFVLTFIGAMLAWTLVSAKDVLRTDGSRVILIKNPTIMSELKGLVETLLDRPSVVLLFPMFFASNFFYTYQFNEVNSPKFTLRTRTLNNLCYWLFQMIGALIFGYALDIKGVSRPNRARGAWVALLVITFAIWGGGYAFQRNYTRDDPGKIFDWTDNGYGGPFVLYIFYGFFDAAWQTCVYWFMGALTNNARDLANFAGFYKGIQSAGSAIAYAIDLDLIDYMTYFATCWGLLAGSLFIAAPLILFKVKPTVTIEEDLKHSDESYDEVAAGKGGDALIRREI